MTSPFASLFTGVALTAPESKVDEPAANQLDGFKPIKILLTKLG
jgi:hypothetical protein